MTWTTGLRRGRRALVTGLLALTVGVQAAASTPEDFARPPEIADVVVSPSGKRMAFSFLRGDGWRRLAVLDLDPVGAIRVIAGFADADVFNVAWVNDQRLVYEAAAREVEVSVDRAGTFAVDHDGSNPARLISWRPETLNRSAASTIRTRMLPYGWYFRSTIDDGSNDVIVYKTVTDGVGDLKEVQLARLNALTGQLQNLSFGMPEGTRRWLLDGRNEPRVIVARRDGRDFVYWRKPGTDSWEPVADFNPLTESGFTPRWLDSDTRLIVQARIDGDTTALHAFDLATKNLVAEPLVKVTGFDLVPTMEVDTQSRRLLGVHFHADKATSYWFDPALAKIQQSIDAALPAGRVNRLHCGRCESARFFVVHSSSDRQPGELFLFDREKVTLRSIGETRPWISEDTQGPRSLHKVTTRDGLIMPVYITRPARASDAPRPAVVLVHGGPWVRGATLGWRAEAQFLASQGYLVLEPEFRGSTGYGHALYRAGWREWGGKMQDDLVDAVQWSVKQGLVDAARVCVVGSSYGGYAALMAPIATPGVFRCAASFAGVTDIDLMYELHRSDLPEEARRHSMPVLIGDRVQDAERLRKASPMLRAGEIKVPVLLAHGGADRRVPLKHAQKFESAARDAGVPLEMHVYPDEGHGFIKPSNEADYLGRLARFLARSIGAAPDAQRGK
jgi:dipeptidyl aminopeptidase/acylaminoacyl peptidase